MFREGSDAPRLHDGEESGTTIAPFLGFCEADDPDLVNFKRFAGSPENPLWDPVTRGIAWEKTMGTTFPGFTTELSGARTEAELARAIGKLCGLADVDGQWWWWPMKPGNPAVVRGLAGKCGWATGVFLIQFLRTILGVRWDAPTGTLTVKPFAPWRSFGYSGLVLGSMRLDLAIRRDARTTRVAIAHNQESLPDLRVILRAPAGTRDARLVSCSPRGAIVPAPVYFGRPTWEIRFSNVTQQQVRARVRWA
jgi:hypothetical protein